MNKLRTLYDKLIDSHTVRTLDDKGNVLLYIDRTILNEYTSPQAFTGLREAGRPVWSSKKVLFNIDHVNPTRPERTADMTDAGGALQVSYFRKIAMILILNYLMCWILDKELNMS